MSIASTRICRVVEALYSAAPGHTHLNSFLEEAQQGSVESFSDNLLNTHYSNSALGQRVADNLRFASESLRDIAANYLSSRFDSRDDRGTVLIEALDLLATLESDSTWGKTAELFNAAVEVTLVFSKNSENTTTDLATLMAGDAVDFNNISQSITGDDYNNSDVTSGLVKLDTFYSGSVNGSIHFQNDNDWFEITLTAGTTYTISIRPQLAVPYRSMIQNSLAFMILIPKLSATPQMMTMQLVLTHK
jgi:hypothetical protein